MKIFKNLTNKNYFSIYMNKNKLGRTKKYFSFYMIYLLFIFICFIPYATTIKKIYYAGYYMRLYLYEITIKIKGTGELDVTSSKFTACPVMVYHNSINIKGTDCHKVTIPEGSEINTLTLKWSRTFNYLAYVFESMEHIIEIDMSNYDTTGVTEMRQMFYNCHSLTSINFKNINTASVKNMRLLFGNCYALKHLDVTGFDTSQVTDMHFMFSYCQSLTSLDVSKFKTQNVKQFEGMFGEMQKLESIYVKNFDTSNGINMRGMFYNCPSLTTLDVTNFDTSSVTDMSIMFSKLDKITTLDLSHFDTRKVENMGSMFSHSKNLKELDLSNFITPSLKAMEAMFYRANKITSINMPNFNTAQVTTMTYTFCECYELLYLDLSSFDTSNVITMSYMFSNANKLTSIKLSNFRTPSLKDTNFMFRNNYALTSLDLNNFDTSKVTDMHDMFLDCQNLKVLKISNFDTSSAQSLKEMFADCFSLTSLDLPKFVTTNVNNMYCMFYNTANLKVINMANIDTSSMTDMSGLFYGNKKLEYINIQNYNENKGNSYSLSQSLDYVPENVVVCITSNVISKLKAVLQTKRCHTIYCGNDWKTKQKKMVYGTDLTCVQDCSNYRYEHNGWCYASCPENVDFCNPEDDIVETTSIATTDKPTTIVTHLSTQLTAETEKPTETEAPTTILTEAPTTILTEAPTTIQTQSPTTASVSTETLDDNNTRTSTSVTQADLLNESTNMITGSISLDSNQSLYQNIINNYVNGVSVNDDKERVIEGEEGTQCYHLTTSKYDKMSIYENHNNSKRVSRVDLGNCETILKNYYHINQNDSLIILTLEKVTNDSTERAMLYEVYEPYNKTKLNLSICDNTTISIFIPVVLSEELQNLYNQAKEDGYDIFDLNDAFYNDKCTPFTTPNGTDILLSDRITYYFHNNETLCQSNCEFSNYDFETQYLECSCDTSNSEIPTKDIESFTPKTFYESFYDVLKFSNYKVLWCYKLAFHINSITINKGSIIAIVYFIIYFIFLLIYIFKGITSFQLSIAEKLVNNFKAPKEGVKIADKKDIKNFDKKTSVTEPSSKRKMKAKKLSPKSIQIFNINNFPPKKNNKSVKIFVPDNKQLQNAKNSRNKMKPFKKKQQQESISSEKNMLTLSKGVSFKSEKFNFKEKYKTKALETNNLTNKEDKLSNFELNDLDYGDAIKLDKRGFFKTYWSILKREHLIIFTFFIRNDYNLVSVKFARLIFLICTDMAMNVFFFADETMHRMFLDYGKYNFLIQIEQIVISTVVSQIMEVFICFLILTDKHFFQIKNLKVVERNKMFTIIRCAKRKITFFFIFTFIMFAFYWYSIACFCAVYINTQGAFIKDSISSFILGLLYPFILYLFPALLRIISLKAGKAKLSCSCLYKISDIIPFF